MQPSIKKNGDRKYKNAPARADQSGTEVIRPWSGTRASRRARILTVLTWFKTVNPRHRPGAV